MRYLPWKLPSRIWSRRSVLFKTWPRESRLMLPQISSNMSLSWLVYAKKNRERPVWMWSWVQNAKIQKMSNLQKKGQSRWNRLYQISIPNSLRGWRSLLLKTLIIFVETENTAISTKVRSSTVLTFNNGTFLPWYHYIQDK
jgi:hypothetical protein